MGVKNLEPTYRRGLFNKRWKIRDYPFSKIIQQTIHVYYPNWCEDMILLFLFWQIWSGHQSPWLKVSPALSGPGKDLSETGLVPLVSVRCGQCWGPRLWCSAIEHADPGDQQNYKTEICPKPLFVFITNKITFDIITHRQEYTCKFPIQIQYSF